MGIRDEDLEHMKAFVLDHPPVIAQKHHDDLEVGRRRDVASHGGVVAPVEKEFAEKFDGLALGDIRR